MMMGMDGIGLLAKELAGGGGDTAGRRAMRRPQVRMERDRGVLGVEALRRGVEQAETFARHAGDDFGGNAAQGHGLAHAEEAARARHGSHHGVGVKRSDRPEIDNFDLPSFGRQFLRGGQGFVHHGAVSHDGQVAPCRAIRALPTGRASVGRRSALRW